MRLKSRRSFTKANKVSAPPSILPRYSCCFEVRGPATSSSRMLPKPVMALMGVLSSWEGMEMNWSLRTSACSSASIFWRCRCSTSVRSRVTLAYPVRLPSASVRAVMTASAQKRVPSLRRRQPRSSTRPNFRALASSLRGLPAFKSSGVKKIS
ncbi:hypothetical protein D3C72_1738710 [compost metagenome]